MNWNEKKEKIAGYYTGLINEHGYDPRSCDYGRPESQEKKFNVLSNIITEKHKTLLDVGCGFADYADFLKQNHPHIIYSGVDLTQDFVVHAKKQNPDLDICVMDILSENPSNHDMVTANGIFYLLGEDAENTMHQIIERMFFLCDKTVAFNSLSSWCKDQEEGEFYADPLKTVEFCRSITPYVTLRHDYHDRDFTVYMQREQVG